MNVDAREWSALAEKMRRYESIMPRSVADGALRESAKEMLTTAKSLAPRSGKKIYIPKSKIGAKNKNDKLIEGSYRRGGATRKDLRIRTVKGQGKEIGRVLVGVSKKADKVGWRTHFITRGYTDRGGKKHAGRDFLKPAFTQHIDEARQKFKDTLETRFKAWLEK
jgi:hypothetical protein